MIPISANNEINPEVILQILINMYWGTDGEPVPIIRTVYGTSDSEAYQCSDGAFYRVRKERANGN